METRNKVKSNASVSSTQEVDSDLQDLRSLILNAKNELSNKIEDSINKLNESLIRIENKFQQKIDEQNEIITKQREEIVNLEIKINETNQYMRRNNVEIGGLSKDIDDNDLEQHVVMLCKSANIDISPNDIEACHWLDSKKSKVIIRFTNRKFCVRLLKNRKEFNKKQNSPKINLNVVSADELSDQVIEDKSEIKSKIYINENLCPYYKLLWMKCRSLHKHNEIYKYWSYNGTIKIILEKDSDPIKIQHLNHLVDIFPDFNFYNS